MLASLVVNIATIRVRPMSGATRHAHCYVASSTSSRTGTRSISQPLQFAHAAAEELLTWLGFTHVQRNPDETVTSATPSEVPGFILTRDADMHGRCIALVGKGKPSQASGTQVNVDVQLLRATASATS
ncbi:hypothetical protein [Streptomyces sp. NPDC001678]|uniref:hypothetical protein n=1 Tax=Streptomyces sp. NPDC001678 TaxID=3364599 RepID=UPI0036CAAB03